MKKSIKIKHGMIKYIFIKIVKRIIVGVLIALLWKRTNNIKSFVGEESIFFFIGLGMLWLAWSNYLEYDGYSLMGKNNYDRDGNLLSQIKNRRLETSGISDDDYTLANIISNGISAAIFIIPSAILLYK